MKTVLVTGASGFVGRNLSVTLRTQGYQVLEYNRSHTLEDLEKFTQNCDFVVHLAGVNRPQDPKEFYKGNVSFTEILLKYLKQAKNKAPVLISSSIQASLDNDYGKSKKQGEDLLRRYGRTEGVRVVILRFANIYGKWSRPNYNSVIATWCYNTARDLPLEVSDPQHLVSFVYIDDVVKNIMDTIEEQPIQELPVDTVSLQEVIDLLRSYKASRYDFMVPNIQSRFAKNLYSTYLSFLPKDAFAYPLDTKRDERGSFTEVLKSTTLGQISVNVCKPGIVKGQHWHHTKNEKFLVVAGQGMIRFRHLITNEIIEYVVSDDVFEVVDIPIGYVHNIENTGTEDLVTLMWANESFDPEKPDTYVEEV